jgi:transcriptional regulator with XRE-family HTH domain
MNVKEVLGSNIRFYRNHAKISQENLAESVGISAKHISSIENGKAFPSADLLERFSNRLDISIPSLFLPLGEIDNGYISKIEKIMNEELSEAVKRVISKIKD